MCSQPAPPQRTQSNGEREGHPDDSCNLVEIAELPVAQGFVPVDRVNDARRETWEQYQDSFCSTCQDEVDCARILDSMDVDIKYTHACIAVTQHVHACIAVTHCSMYSTCTLRLLRCLALFRSCTDLTHHSSSRPQWLVLLRDSGVLFCRFNGAKPSSGWPLYICLHGGVTPTTPSAR